MSDLDDRISALVGRVSREAGLYIDRLREHPRFPELLAEIETLQRALIETDIEQAFRRISIRRRQP